MGEVTTAKVFDHDGALAVDLPEGFSTTDGRVRIIRQGNSVLIEPAPVDAAAWLARVQSLAAGRFMEEGRQQPPMPDDESLFD